MSPKLDLDLGPAFDLELKQRVAAWEHDLRPRNRIEQFLAKQVASISIEIERDERVAAVRTAYQARVGPEIEAREREDQAIRIGQELLYQASDEWLSRNRYPSAHDRARAKKGPTPVPAELGVHRLKSTAEGCRWLIERWVELMEIFDERLVWGPADELKAILLLGKTPDDEDNAEIRELRLASSVMTGIKPSHIAALTEENVGRPIPSREEASDLVKAICKRTIDRLQALASVRDELFRIDPDQDRLRFAFDGGDVGKELNRRLSTRRREFLKMLEALTKQQKKRVDDEADDGPNGPMDDRFWRAMGESPLSKSDHRRKEQRQLKARRKEELKARSTRIINGGENVEMPSFAREKIGEAADNSTANGRDELHLSRRERSAAPRPGEGLAPRDGERTNLPSSALAGTFSRGEKVKSSRPSRRERSAAPRPGEGLAPRDGERTNLPSSAPAGTFSRDYAGEDQSPRPPETTRANEKSPRSPKKSPAQRPLSARREAPLSKGNVSEWPRGPGESSRHRGV